METNLYLPGYSIPHHFSEAEIQAFLAKHLDNFALTNYLETRQPPWGILIQEPYGEILVWIDASNKTHVVDITNMSIATEIQKAPYQAPDSGFFENLSQSFDNLFGRAQSVGMLLAAILGLLVIRDLTKRS